MAYLLSSAFRQHIPEEYRGALMRLDDVALEALLLRIVEALPEDKLHEFETALSLSDSRVLGAFLTSEVPHLHSLLQETVGSLQKGAQGMIDVIES